MSDTDSPTVIDAAELTLLVGEPGARAYDAYPIDLADRTEAQRSLDDLRRDGESITLVGIEFDDPEEPGNRMVLVGEDLAAARFVDIGRCQLPIDAVAAHVATLARVLLDLP